MKITSDILRKPEEFEKNLTFILFTSSNTLRHLNKSMRGLQMLKRMSQELKLEEKIRIRNTAATLVLKLESEGVFESDLRSV